MGMISNYTAVSAELLQAIRNEKISLYGIGPELDIDKSWQANLRKRSRRTCTDMPL